MISFIRIATFGRSHHGCAAYVPFGSIWGSHGHGPHQKWPLRPQGEPFAAAQCVFPVTQKAWDSAEGAVASVQKLRFGQRMFVRFFRKHEIDPVRG